MNRLTQEQRREHNKATNCLICAKSFKSADKEVHNHDHLTGEYGGPPHNTCNLNYRIDPKKVKIPCIIHKLKGILFLCYSYFHNCQFFIAIFMILISLAISFVAILSIKVALAFLLSIFCIVAIFCSGYNAHLILSAVKPRHGKITVIPNNMER